MEVINATVPALSLTGSHFGMVEYLIFSALLAVSALVGVYYGFVQRQSTVSDYLLGGKKMGIVPVALSNVASHTSGITLLGVPAEVYMYGTQNYGLAASIIGVTLMIVFCYLPVFHPLQLTSAFQYLEMRFNKQVRFIGSFIFAVSLIVYIPIVIYVPALAFNQVSGVSVHVIAPIICVVCIFYTTVGGLKAVVWTDALQSVVIVVSVVSVIVIGTAQLGGVGEVFRVAREGHRLELFNFNPDPFARNTFWTVLIGTHFFWLANFAVHPGSVQKFICVPTLRGAIITMWISCGCVIVIISLTCFLGLMIFTKFHGCDPMASQMIQKSGQLLPLYVLDVARDYPGLSGLFISGVVSAALSTMSASLNTVAGTLFEDFVDPILSGSGKVKSEASASLTMKLIVLTIGTVCVLLIFVVEKLGGIMQLSISLTSITSGAMIFIFSVGIFLPWINAKGAIWGAASSLLTMAWVVGGSQYYILSRQLRFPPKITSVDVCPLLVIGQNATVSRYTGLGSPVIADSVPLLYQTSYMYFYPLGCLVGLLVGGMVSLMTGGQDLSTLRRELITPCMRRFLPLSTPPSKSEEHKLIKNNNNNIRIVISEDAS